MNINKEDEFFEITNSYDLIDIIYLIGIMKKMIVIISFNVENVKY